MSKAVRVIFILAVLAALFVPAMIAMNYVAIAQIYSYSTDHLANLLGMNLYLIRAAVVLAMVPFFYALKLFFSLNSTKRKIGSGIMTAFVVLYNIGLYQATHDLYFTFQEGRILKWYAITPDGVKLFDRAGVDPNYGIPLKPVTPEVIRNLKMIEKGDFRTVDPSQAAWFNPISGDPTLWYYQSPEGGFEFYNKPGFHPFTNEPLRPVTKEIYFRWKERLKASPAAIPGTPEKSTTQAVRLDSGSPDVKVGRREQRLAEFRTLLNPVGLAAGKRNIAIMIAASGSASGFAPEQALYGHLKPDRGHLITDLFRQDLITRGYFNDLYQGDKELLKLATNASRVDYLILGRLNYSFRRGTHVDNDLVSCEITLSFKAINQAGDVVRGDSFRVVGPGFSENAALERGIELLSDQFYERILKPIL